MTLLAQTSGLCLQEDKSCDGVRSAEPHGQSHLVSVMICSMRNLVTCRDDQPMMLINGDVLWSDTRACNVVPLAFGGMDRLIEHPSCNVRNDTLGARLWVTGNG